MGAFVESFGTYLAGVGNQLLYDSHVGMPSLCNDGRSANGNYRLFTMRRRARTSAIKDISPTGLTMALPIVFHGDLAVPDRPIMKLCP